jgi:hypothetical protein
MVNVILLVLAGIVLIVYITRRRARLRSDESDKK